MLHHSDRGSQYASDAYQAALDKAKLRYSMTDGTIATKTHWPSGLTGF